MRYYFLSTLLWCVFFCNAQINGLVTNENNQPLPFVNIFVAGTSFGTTTNEDGNFILTLSELNVEKGIEITFQYLGFQTLKHKWYSKQDEPLRIQLVKQETSLDEVIIASGVNPANKIIRAAIKSRRKNLDAISEFTAQFYSRGLWRINNAPEKILGQELGDLGGGLDSTRTGIIYLSETVSDIKYRRPDDFSEKITASKVSGNDNGFSFNSAIDANFSFYENVIDLNNQIISPIAKSAFSYYKYKLEGTTFEEGQLINKIKVIPRRANDKVFTGYIYIVEDTWQIYGVQLTVSGQSLQVPVIKEVTFNQNFTFHSQEGRWVKKLQVIDFKFGFFGLKGNGRYTAQYQNYNFDPNFEKKSFTNELLSFDVEANKKDSLFWHKIRPVPLTVKEKGDYLLKDSIQAKRNTKVYKDSIDGVNNKFKWSNPLLGYSYQNTFKKYSYNYSGLLGNFSYNTVQGWNISSGISYNKWSDSDRKKTFSAFAKANYGFSDRRLRYIFGFSKKFNAINRATLVGSAGVKALAFNQKDISPLWNTAEALLNEQSFLKLYENRFAQLGYRQELINGLFINAAVSYQDRRPLFNTTDQTWFPKKDKVFTSNNPLQPSNFTGAVINKHSLWHLKVGAQYNFGQKYYSYPSGKFNVQNDKFPILKLFYTKGIGASNASINFDFIELEVKQNSPLGAIGNLAYTAKAGSFINSGSAISFVDYKHFNGNQLTINSKDFLGRFNLLPYYSRSTNDNFIELHAEHNFKGWILGKLPLINKLNFNVVASGKLLSTVGVNPYFEYAIGIDNIGWGVTRFLRVDYVTSVGSSEKSGWVVGVSLDF